MARIDQFIFNAIARARNKNYIFVYDISSDKERNQVFELLTGYGIRVQFSVFELKLTKKQLAQAIVELKLLGLKTGFVKIYRIEQQTKATTIGTEKENTILLDDDCIII